MPAPGQPAWGLWPGGLSCRLGTGPVGVPGVWPGPRYSRGGAGLSPDTVPADTLLGLRREGGKEESFKIYLLSRAGRYKTGS